MPNITDANVLRIKTLIKQGKIEEARTQLERFNDPRAVKILAQFNAHYPDPAISASKQKNKSLQTTPPKEKSKRETVPADPPPAPAKRSLSGCGGIVLLLITCAALWAVNTPSKPKPFTNSVRESVRLTCEYNYEYSWLSEGKLHSACNLEADWFVKQYPNGAQICYDISDSPEKFIDCMIEKNMDFSGEYIAAEKPPPLPTTDYSSYPADCAAAKRMGLSEFQAGKYSHLDRDNDGKACYGD